MIKKVMSTVYYDEPTGAYLSVVDGRELGVEGNYVLHIEGNQRALYKMWKQIKHEVKPEGTDLYCTLKKMEYFGNHVEPSEIPGLFKYTGD
jgi:hypothetical protein